MTILEILVVISIMVMVTAAAIPLMSSGLENRKMREAARITAAFIGGARSRAIETGRPVGVVLEQYAGTNYSMNLSYAEVPPPYAGDYVDSVAVGGVGPSNPPAPPTWGVINRLGSASEDASETQVRAGDLIRFGYQGRLFMIQDPTGAATTGYLLPRPTPSAPWRFVTTDVSGTTSGIVVPPNLSSGIPYQVFRQPLRSASAPLQLPAGTVIDLQNSGMGLTGTFLLATNPSLGRTPMIVFSPGGTVQFLWDTPNPVHPSAPIFLLVGRTDGMADSSNLADASNFWIGIGYQTGHITTTENKGAGSLAAARQFAQSGQSMGGR